MNLFFDTSALFKLYHSESGTKELTAFFSSNLINAIYLSEITSIEFSSAVWKKCRKKEIKQSSAKLLIEKFKIDSEKYNFINQSKSCTSLASVLIGKYWNKGLRTLDSLQLASALTFKSDLDVFITSDILLSEIALSENLKVMVF
jgi:predicted nucleic acid-binding protein